MWSMDNLLPISIILWGLVPFYWYESWSCANILVGTEIYSDYGVGFPGFNKLLA